MTIQQYRDNLAEAVSSKVKESLQKEVVSLAAVIVADAFIEHVLVLEKALEKVTQDHECGFCCIIANEALLSLPWRGGK